MGIFFSCLSVFVVFQYSLCLSEWLISNSWLKNVASLLELTKRRRELSKLWRVFASANARRQACALTKTTQRQHSFRQCHFNIQATGIESSIKRLLKHQTHAQTRAHTRRLDPYLSLSLSSSTRASLITPTLSSMRILKSHFLMKRL